MSEFHRYPHTPHLCWLAPGQPRDDKVLSKREAEAFIRDELVIEEKVDGANLGFSLDASGSIRAQNRGQFLHPPYHGQFKHLETWLRDHEDALFDALTSTSILFGEWCAARHTIYYDRLPDFWLLFDIFDTQEDAFWASQRRDAMGQSCGLAVVPRIAKGRFGLEDLQNLSKGPSKLGPGAAEGIVLRSESARFLEAKSKLVNPTFTQSIGEHWRDRPIEWNRCAA